MVNEAFIEARKYGGRSTWLCDVERFSDVIITVHGRFKIGTKRLAGLFNEVRDALKRQGIIREIFTFVDSS